MDLGDDRTEQAANALPVPAVGLAADWVAENLGRTQHPATRYQLSQLLRPDFPESVGRPAGMELSIADKNRVLDTLANATKGSPVRFSNGTTTTASQEELDAFLAEWFTNPEAVKAILEGQ